ncbi:hypothetical protein EDC01DRAFT_656518 [Geopyxis carbonaria]|nr:hypothetical protein EDC01DRAFT_656518 [Geopyxis carbonaria]
MSPMPRRRRPQPTTEGWSHIPATHSRGPLRLDSTPAINLTSDVAPAQSLSTLTSRLTSARETVLSATPLQPVFASARAAAPGSRLDVLGLGSFHGATRGASMLQLALALEMQPRPEKVVVRDPAFTDRDIEFLRDLGLTAERGTDEADPLGEKADGEGIQEGTREDTLWIVAPHLEYDVLSQVLQQTTDKIGLLVCNDLRSYVDLKIGGDDVKKVFEKFLQEKDGWKEAILDDMPDVGEGRAFNHLAVYWKDLKTDGKEEHEDVVNKPTEKSLEEQLEGLAVSDDTKDKPKS